MGTDIRRVALGRTKKSTPPILSHEFFIQNHGDVISSILIVFMLGFMFQPTVTIAQLFILPQYNETISISNGTENYVVYSNGIADFPAILFYSLTCIAIHCALQEYVFDKLQRRLHLSKTRQTKFNESAELLVFSTYSIVHAGYILHELGIYKDVTLLWMGYPEVHRYFNLSIKLFYIFQLAYWTHQFPEFYFQKLRKEEIYARIYYCISFLGFIGIAYFFNFVRVGLALLFLEYLSRVLFHFGRFIYFSGKVRSSWTAFKPWNILSPIIRLFTIVVSVLTFWYGFRSLESPYIDIANGNYNTRVVRLNCLVSVLLIQLFMVYKFSQFQLSHLNERRSVAAQNKKKATSYVKLKKTEV